MIVMASETARAKIEVPSLFLIISMAGQFENLRTATPAYTTFAVIIIGAMAIALAVAVAHSHGFCLRFHLIDKSSAVPAFQFVLHLTVF